MTEQPAFDMLDLPSLQTGNLIAYLGQLHEKHAALGPNPDPFAEQAIILRTIEVQREIAIRNSNALAALADFPALPPGVVPQLLDGDTLQEIGRSHDTEGPICATVRRLLGHIACLVARQRQAIADACAQVAADGARALEAAADEAQLNLAAIERLMERRVAALQQARDTAQAEYDRQGAALTSADVLYRCARCGDPLAVGPGDSHAARALEQHRLTCPGPTAAKVSA